MDRSARERISWRCRRGLKELDLLLEHFARERYPTALPAQRQAFERLLALPDPVLVELLLLPAQASGAPAPGSPQADCGTSAPRAESGVGLDRDIAEIAALVVSEARR